MSAPIIEIFLFANSLYVSYGCVSISFLILSELGNALVIRKLLRLTIVISGYTNLKLLLKKFGKSDKEIKKMGVK